MPPADVLPSGVRSRRLCRHSVAGVGESRRLWPPPAAVDVRRLAAHRHATAWRRRHL